MVKLLIACGIFILMCLSAPSAFSDGIEMIIHDSKCTDEEIVIEYSLVNTRNFNRPNIGIGFKVTADDKVAACKEIRTDIPKGSDGTEVNKITLEIPCKEKTLGVSSRVFRAGLSRYKVEEWFSDCPPNEDP